MLLAAADQVHEDTQDHHAGGVHAPLGDRLVLQDEGGNEHHADRGQKNQAEAPDVHRLVVGRRADVRQRAMHQRVVDQAEDQADRADAERGMPAPGVAVLGAHVVADPRGQQHRDGRADVHRHVVDGEGTVDLGIVALVDLAHQVAGVRLEEAVADDDHAERDVQEVGVVGGNPQHRVAQRQHHGTEQHGAAGADQLVADPAADRRRGVDQCRGGTPDQVRLAVDEAEPLHHVGDHQHLHAVEAEALPHFDQEDGAE